MSTDLRHHDGTLDAYTTPAQRAAALRTIATQPDAATLAEVLGLTEYDRVVGNGHKGAAKRRQRVGSITGTRRGK